jgi:hypothetical protein
LSGSATTSVSCQQLSWPPPNRRDEDTLGALIQECCDLRGWYEASELRALPYLDFINAAGERPLTAR